MYIGPSIDVAHHLCSILQYAVEVGKKRWRVLFYFRALL